MVDIDHFKRLNDTRGHQVGDECLRRVAALCSSALRRAGDCFARYGGEEFAAILVNIDLDHAITLAEHMRKVVERDGGITISVGIASRVPAPADDPLALVADADDALYRAKHDGRNCVRVAESSRMTIVSGGA
jgi:diguanylate cyclase (GGDEF)-like protein